MGRGVFRNYYKVNLDRTKGEGDAGEEGGFGWSGVERWAENADNCD